MTEQERLNKYFEFKCWKGLEKRGFKGQQEYEDRLKYEIKVVTGMGFSGYFLIVADFLFWAREHNIPVGPGRGSVAGALTAYCMGITVLDPLRFGLLFERFLNPDRISMPDIDCDFCEEDRHKIIDYVISKYRRDHVAQIGTFGTMKARGSIRDVARTLGHPVALGDKLANLIPPPEQGKAIPLAKSYERVPALSAYHEKPDTVEGQTLCWADKVENTIRSLGMHASGLVISPIPLSKLVPLVRGKEGEYVTQFEMNNVEDIGLIKFDFLGLKTLTVIKKTCDMVEEYHGVKIDIDNILYDDALTYQRLREGDTCGIFQLETSSGIKDLLIQIQPTRLEDIIALVAMYRPGPLASDGMQMYLNVRAGKGEPIYPFPELEEILAETEGWIIYQEQCMKIARVIAKYTPGRTDDLRKAIGKKLLVKMAEHEETFVKGGVKGGFDRSKVQKLWDDMEKFGAYGFNKAHAACYGFISYQTAYLKAHYPVEFMCAVLTCDSSKKEKVIKYINECKRMGIDVLPPDINESSDKFTVTVPTNPDKAGAIRFGLSAVKNLGNEPVSYITVVRGKGFGDILDFADRVDLGKINRRKLESLVLAGAFDSTGHSRTSLLGAIDSVMEHKVEVKKFESKMETYDKRIFKYEARQEMIAVAEMNGTKKPAKLKEPKKPDDVPPPSIPDCAEMPEAEILAHEKELLGFYISGHPLYAYSSALKNENFTAIESLHEKETEDYVTVAGIMAELKPKTTKAGKEMAFGVIEDTTGQVNVVFFSASFGKFRHIILSGNPIQMSGKLEMTRDDEDKLLSVKILAFEVKELVRGKIKYEPINVIVAPCASSDLQKLLDKYEGSDHQVNVTVRTKDGTIFRLNKVYSIGGNRSAFLRELGRLNN